MPSIIRAPTDHNLQTLVNINVLLYYYNNDDQWNRAINTKIRHIIVIIIMYYEQADAIEDIYRKSVCRGYLHNIVYIGKHTA